MTIESALVFALSVFSGLIVALITLAIFHLVFAPKLRFSEQVRLFYPATVRQPRYSVRFVRLGLIDLIDVTISCRLTVTDIAKTGKNLKEYYDIKVSSEQVLFLQRGSLIVHLKLNESGISKIDENSYFGRSINVRYPEYGLRFEDIFLDFEKVDIQLFIIGHDRFTGVKKIYLSPNYYLRNIQMGRWSRIRRKTVGKWSGLKVVPSGKLRSDNY